MINVDHNKEVTNQWEEKRLIRTGCHWTGWIYRSKFKALVSLCTHTHLKIISFTAFENLGGNELKPNTWK